MRERVTIAAPDGAVKQLDMPDGTRYSARGGGMYDVHPAHAKYVKDIGGFVPNVGPTILAGPRCPGCGFASYFAKCSRCGADRREAPIAVRPQDLSPQARVAVFGSAGHLPTRELTMRAALGRIAQAARVVSG